MKVSERYTWIDCIKGIGIFLVVLGHIYKDNYIGLWIYSFHMPLFFMLSGYLMYAKSVSIFSSVTNNFLLYLFFGIIGTMLIGIVCKMFIINNKVIEYCGIYSIIILAIHEPIKRILMKAIMMGGEKIGFVITKDSFSENYLLGMLLCLIVMACYVPVITMLSGLKRRMGKIGAFVFEFIK